MGLPPRSAPPASGLSGLSGSGSMLLLLDSSWATSRGMEEWRCIGSTPLPVRGRLEPARGKRASATVAELRERDRGVVASSSMEPSRLALAAEHLSMLARKSRRLVPAPALRRRGEGGQAAAAAARQALRGLIGAAGAVWQALRGRAAVPAHQVAWVASAVTVEGIWLLGDVCLGVYVWLQNEWNGERGRGLVMKAARAAGSEAACYRVPS